MTASSARTVLITGATHGLGRALSRELASRGAVLTCNGRVTVNTLHTAQYMPTGGW
jgi:NAD(P)-dependent dehydrogenase (short-subunit alcohol dehydrogenase family)